MFNPSTRATVASVLALVFFASGCSDESANNGDDGCFDYASFKSDTRSVAFQTDVLKPVFQASCTFSSTCHGTVSGSAGKVYLGPPAADTPTQADIDAIFAQIIGVASSELPAMKLVEQGSPEKSFLMHKMDGKLTCADASCSAPPCSSPMPLGQPMNTNDPRLETVRIWIAQGAKND